MTTAVRIGLGAVPRGGNWGLGGRGTYGSLRGCALVCGSSWNVRFAPSVEGCSIGATGLGCVAVGLRSGYLVGHLDIK